MVTVTRSISIFYFIVAPLSSSSFTIPPRSGGFFYRPSCQSRNKICSKSSLFHRSRTSCFLSRRTDEDIENTSTTTTTTTTTASTTQESTETNEPSGTSNESSTTTTTATATTVLPNDSPPQSSMMNFLQEKVFLSINPTPEIIAIMTIYFVEGALGLARLAQTFLLKDQLHLGPAELSALSGLFTLPWTIKPLYGFLSDGVPIFGYRRRSYLILAGLLGCLSYTALGAEFWGVLDSSGGGLVDGVAEGAKQSLGFLSGQLSFLQGTVIALLLSGCAIALSDVVADGIVVQRTRDSDDPKLAGGLQSLCWGSAAIGGLISSYFSGSLLEVMSPRDVFAITAVLPLLVASIALLIEETPVTTKKEEGIEIAPSEGGAVAAVPVKNEDGEETLVVAGVQEQVKALYSAFQNPAVWRPALFLFLWQSTPTGEGAFLYFLTNDLGFGPEFLGRVGLVTAGAGLFGVWAYQKFLRTVPIKSILFWSSIASMPLGLSQLLLITHANRSLGIPDAAFVFGDDVALSILGRIAFLPTLVLAARICPPGIEAVLFATLMSINNGASSVGTELGALLTKWLGVTENNFENLGLLTIICNVSSLYPLVFINWLDEVGTVSEAEIEKEDEEQHNKNKILDVPESPRKDKFKGVL